MEKKILVEQVSSSIRRNKKQLVCLKALGLGEVGKKSVLKSTPPVLGLVRKMQHYLKVKELD
mgnify:CR=1 FL=1